MNLTSRAVATILGVALLCVVPHRAAAQRANLATVSAELNRGAVQAGQDAVVAIVFEVKAGYHAQSHTPKTPNLIALTIKTDESPSATAGQAIYPAGKDETYPGLGVLNVYDGRTIFYVPVKVGADVKEGPLKISGTIRYQICDDKTCFPPKSTPWSVQTKVVAKGAPTPANAEELFKGYDPAAATTAPATQRGGGTRGAAVPPAGGGGGPGASASAATDADLLGDADAKRGMLAQLGLAFLAGILFNLVPCVLPMLPIKVLGIAQAAENDRGRTIALASIFGAGVIAVFAGLALFILVLKKFTWGEQFSNPWFAWGVVILLAVLAAWMFGLLNVNLPGGVYSVSPRHDTMIGNFELGVLTAVLSTPCTGPFFPPLMLWAQQQPVAIGVTAVMMVGVGMAFPYVLLSAFPELARRFPRVGPWAELFKQMMGFLLLGAAVFFAAGRFVTGAALYWSLVPVAVIAAIFLLMQTVGNGAHARGVVIASVLAVLMIGGTTTMAATFVSPVKWEHYSDAVVDGARKDGKIVLVKFTANWCLNCQYIERSVFHDKAAAAALERHGVVTVKADLTADDAPGWARLKSLSATGGIPLTAIYAPGREQPVVIDSVYTTSTLVRVLDRVDGGKGRVATAQ